MWLTIFWLILTSSVCQAQSDIIAALIGWPTISRFTSLLQAHMDLVEEVKDRPITVFAPTNAAFDTWEQALGGRCTDDAISSLLRYHIVKQTYPSSSFQAGPFFPASFLTNTTYTNVTDGARVECAQIETGPAVISGLRAVSSVVQADIIVVGGLAHIIDSVLTVPLTVSATLTKAGLTEAIAMIADTGWAMNARNIEVAQYQPDTTIFIANNRSYTSAGQGLKDLSKTALQSVFDYGVLQDQLLCSPNLQNGSSFNTPEGEKIHVTRVGDEIYVNECKIVHRDFLTANGVLQVLDMQLNPNTSESRPLLSVPPEIGPSGPLGLSKGATAGVALAVGVVLFGATIIIYIFLQSRHRRGLASMDSESAIGKSKAYAVEAEGIPIHELEGVQMTSDSNLDELRPPLPPKDLTERGDRASS